MKENKFKGKAVYCPSGKSGEFSYWACNFYRGCSGLCDYCYLKKGIGKKILGGNVPKLKDCFKNVQHAKEIFIKELKQNLTELQSNGLFFSFTSDFFDSTKELLIYAIGICLLNKVPVKVLTKQTKWISPDFLERLEGREKEVAFGYTLTGHNEKETGCSTNEERIASMFQTHYIYGFFTWASIEPIIDIPSSRKMIYEIIKFCDLYKIGLESGKKYNKKELVAFVNEINQLGVKVYWKDTLLKQAGIERSQLPANCVNRDYNIFKNQ